MGSAANGARTWCHSCATTRDHLATRITTATSGRALFRAARRSATSLRTAASAGRAHVTRTVTCSCASGVASTSSLTGARRAGRGSQWLSRTTSGRHRTQRRRGLSKLSAAPGSRPCGRALNAPPASFRASASLHGAHAPRSRSPLTLPTPPLHSASSFSVHPSPPIPHHCPSSSALPSIRCDRPPEKNGAAMKKRYPRCACYEDRGGYSSGTPIASFER